MPENKHVNNPAYELEKEVLRDEIQLGLEKGVGRLTKKADRFVEPDHFHNTKHLLKQYRRIAYDAIFLEAGGVIEILNGKSSGSEQGCFITYNGVQQIL